MSDPGLTQEQIDAAGLADWRKVGTMLQTRLVTKNFVTGLDLVNAIGEAAEAANHHPDIDLRYGFVNVRLLSHDVFAITERDVALAGRISELAAARGIAADPAAVATVELALDSPDFEKIKPFWRAALGYRDHPRAGDEIRGDDNGNPMLWFQQSGADEPRQRFHLDVRLPPEVAQARIDAAVAAGGSVAWEAPTFVALADAEGNKVCICRG